MEFRDLINSSPVEVKNYSEEARFSLVQGRYVEDFDLQGSSTCFQFLYCMWIYWGCTLK